MPRFITDSALTMSSRRAERTQPWKRSNSLADKNGESQTVYWVKEAAPSSSLRSLPSASSSTVRSRRRFAPFDSYKGEWRDNARHGYGIQRSSGGTIYEGHFERDVRHGEGALFITAALPPHAVTRVYTGQWADGVRSGVGTYFYADSSRYEGQWQSGVRHGQGTLFAANGDTYTGGWDRGQQSGFGSLVKGTSSAASAGDVYEGMYVRGRREGQGMYYYAQKGQIFDGDWVNDQPVTGIIMAAKEFFQQQQQQEAMEHAQAQDGMAVIAPSAAPSPQTSRPVTSSQGGRSGFSLSRPTTAAMLQIARSALQLSSCAPLPRLRLADPDAVLSAELNHLTVTRSPLRSLTQLPPLSSLYAPAVLTALRTLFLQHLQRAAALLLHPQHTRLVRVDEAEALLMDGWKAIGRRGKATGEEVRRALEELGKGEEGKAGRVEGERERETEREDWSTLGFSSFVYALYLLEQGRVVGQALRARGDGLGLARDLGSSASLAPRQEEEEEKVQLYVQVDPACETEAAPSSEYAAAAVFGEPCASDAQ